MDANSIWEVDEAVDEMEAMAHLKPRWIEEPICCDDVVGQVRSRLMTRLAKR